MLVLNSPTNTPPDGLPRRPYSPYEWFRRFDECWPRVDPRIRRLAEDFSVKQRNAMRGIAASVWHSDHCTSEVFDPQSVEEAISFSIWCVYEQAHAAELDAFLNTQH